MAGMSDVLEDALLDLILNGVAIPNVADNAASAPLTNLWIGLHTSSPADAGDQTTNEITTGAYDTYARVAVARTGAGWTITGSGAGTATPAADIVFPAATGGSGGTVTHVSIGSASSAAGVLYLHGTVTPNIVVSSGVTPRLTSTGTTITFA